MAPRIGVVVFPGTNCEHDVVQAVEAAGGRGRAALARRRPARRRSTRSSCPGGFAHGDYLRPGALARFSPVMEAVGDFARAGGPVVGICNGFQVLTEAGLLPGALQKNGRLRFLCQPVRLVVDVHRRRCSPRAPRWATSWSSRSTTSRATTPATTTRCAACRRRTASCCATPTTRTARSTPSPASPTRPATWSASCRTPSAPAPRCSAPTTVWCCCARSSSAAAASRGLSRHAPRLHGAGRHQILHAAAPYGVTAYAPASRAARRGPAVRPLWALAGRRSRRAGARSSPRSALVAQPSRVGGRSARRRRPRRRLADGHAVDARFFEPGACVEYPPTSGDRHLTVFLDAGHGGIDPGGVGETETGQTDLRGGRDAARRARHHGRCCGPRASPWWCRGPRPRR